MSHETPTFTEPTSTRSPKPCRRAGSYNDRGEGVVSTAIAVLIMAFLGALMWVGFQTLWTNTEAKTNEQIEEIGN